MAQVTREELARNVSSFLDRVAEGEEINVTSGGRVIAHLVPSRRQWISGAEFLEVLRDAPSPDPEFADDLARIRKEMNALPERSTPLEWD
jgi:antitoxin (DNA-binding transcriptional repressor) of toxin-antitoxin stability system